MITNYQQGDLVQMLRNSEMGVAPEMVMVHGCNCKKVMGGGIAGQLARTFPEVLAADKHLQRSQTELGMFTSWETESIRVINGYTQIATGIHRRQVNYAAIATLFLKLNQIYKGAHLYIPRIGAGLGGGDWEIIELIIDDATPNVSITVIDFRKGHDPRL